MPKDVYGSEEDHYTDAEKQLIDLSYDYLLKVEQMGASKESLAFSAELVLESMQQKGAFGPTYARLRQYINGIDNVNYSAIE